MFCFSLALLTPLQEPIALGREVDLTIGGDLMGRVEFRDDSDLSTAGGESDDQVRVRGLVSFDFARGSYLGARAELLGTWGDTGDSSTEDLHQLNLDLRRLFGDWDLRIGRSELDFGDGRLISANRSWLFEPNSFDGLIASGRWSRPIFDWTLWYVEGADGPAGLADDRFAGMHADWTITQRTAAELFFTVRRQDGNALEELTFAMRWHGTTVHGLQWSAFGAMQGGDSADGREVWAQATALTFDKELDFGHHVHAELAVAKGDDAQPDDFKRYTPFYIDQHRYNGRADLFAFANLIDLALGYWLEWSEQWSFHLDGHQFWRQNSKDDAYAAFTLTPYGLVGGSTTLGTEFDLYAAGDLGRGFRTDFGLAWFVNAGLPSDKDQIWLFATLGFVF